MLYDPKHDIPSLLTLERFRDFCASKPANEIYMYMHNCDCAIGQMLKANGIFNFYVFNNCVRVYNEPIKGFPAFTDPIMDDSSKFTEYPISSELNSSAHRNTFGQARQAAESYLGISSAKVPEFNL